MRPITRTIKQWPLTTLALALSLSLFHPAFAQTDATLYTAGKDVFPATGTVLGSPAGGFYDGTYFWVADKSGDLSRLTPVDGALPKTAQDYNGSNPAVLIPTFQILVGGSIGQSPAQPAYDSVTGIGYSTNTRSGRAGSGLVRFKVSGNLVTDTISIATPANLSAAKMAAAVIGPDNNLYIGLSGGSSILRVVAPQTGTTQTVQTIGTTFGGKAVNGLAMIGNDLYIAQAGGLARISAVTKCQSGCQATLLPGVDTKQTYWAVAADKASGTVYTAQNAQVVSYSLATGTETPLSSFGIYPNGSLQPFNFSKTGASLTLADVAGIPTLWIGDNLATGLTFEGRIWTLPLVAAKPPPTPTDTTPPTLTLPADITTVAADGVGAVVTYAASASDANVSVPVTCTLPSGSVFPVGVATVTCSAKDAAGNTASGSFLVTVTAPVVIADTTPPVLHLPADITTLATTGAAGAVVNYTATVTDNAGSATIDCAPASGSTFPIGSTTVGCTGIDLAGNTTIGSFLVNVTTAPLADTIPPVLSLPLDIVTVAADINGAVVTYVASASDAGLTVPVDCLPASGATFPVGLTTVHCSATDAAGNSSLGSFTVSVTQPVLPVDTTPPSLSLPANITVDAASSAGSVVDYTATATDGSVTTPALCTPASGSTFPVGINTVTCNAVDAAGNTASGKFNVTVNPFVAPPEVADLAATFTGNRNRPNVGQTLRIAYAVTNRGPNAAASVTFDDTLPSSFRISSVSTTAGTCSAPIGALGGRVNCSLGNMALNQTVTVTMNVVPAVSGPTSNIGSFSSATIDSNPNNNSGTFFMTIR